MVSMRPEIVMSFERSSFPPKINVQKISDIKSVALKIPKVFMKHTITVNLSPVQTKMSTSVLHYNCSHCIYTIEHHI